MTTYFSADSLVVQTQGEVSAADGDYARRRIDAALRHARDPVLFVRVKLTRLANPALERPAVAEATVDLNGRPIRAQVARPTMPEAIDEVHDRLQDRVQRVRGDWQAIRGGRPSAEPDGWRHAGVPTDRPPYYPRPAEERRLIRHKAYSLARATVDEAAFDMDLLDYGFHLFTEDGSGVDSVLYRTGDTGGYRLAQVEPRPERVTSGGTPYTVSTKPAPDLTAEQATERLDGTGLPFVFFRDAESGRGCVVYHRYDGHYGLITPAD